MLTAMRKKTASIVAKGLAGLLIISFGAWGVNDYISTGITGAGAAVAKVGDAEIGPYELQDEVRQDLRRMAPLFGGRLTQQQMIAMGLSEAALQRLVTATLLDQAAGQLGVTTGDAVIAQSIKNDPNFQGLAGGFDRMRFDQLLQANGMNEAMYVANMRKRLAREMVIGSIASIGAAPKTMTDALYRHRGEKRVVETVLMSDDAQDDIPAPDPATLAKYHGDHKQRFTAPEYRKLTYVLLKADDLAKEVAVTEEQLKTAYEAREAEFITAEKRQVLQIVLADQAAADKAASDARGGTSFDDIAKAAGDAVSVIDLGLVTRQDLPITELVEPAFGAVADAVVGPVKSSFGWHLLKIAKVEPGSTKILDDVRADLTKAVAKEKAIDSLFDLANQLENITGGGATIEEASQDLNLKPVKVTAVDSKGKTPAGTDVKGLPAQGGFLNVAFTLGDGEDSTLTESGSDGYFMVRVDGVTPPALRPLEAIRAEVADAWSADQRRKAAETAAATAVKRINGGGQLADVAKELGLEIETSKAFARDGNENDIDRTVRLKAFDAALGKAVLARVDGGYKVVRVAKIEAANPVVDKKQFDELATSLTNDLQGDIAEQFGMALRSSIGVTINRRAVEYALGGGAGVN